MNVLRCATLATLGALAGCGSLTLDPAVREARGDLLDVTRRAVEQSLVGGFDAGVVAEVAAADSTYAIDARRPAGVAMRVAVLEALAQEQRDARLDALDALRDDADDPVFATYVEHLLEQDERWFALALERDSVWNVVAGFFNGVLASGYALLNANPIGVVKPIVHGVDGLIRDVPFDARDRKLAALKKRMAKRGDESPDVLEAIEELEGATVKEELWLATRALERDRVDVAAMHWAVARALRPSASEVEAMALAIEQRVTARVLALDRALRVEPIERDLGLDQRDAPALAASATAKAQLSRDDPRLLAAQRADALERVAAAEARHDDERSRFVWTGRRESHDPLRRHAEARAALHRSVLDRLEPIVWVPATLFRSVLNAFTDPVADQPLVDALARNARNLAQDDPRRAELLRKLAVRLHERGQSEQALAIGRAAGADANALAKYERAATKRAAERAEENERRAAALASQGATIPAYALAPYATRYGFAPEIVDGKRENGEVAPRGVLLEGNKLALDVEREGLVERVEVTLNDVEAKRMEALAREWGWRRKAALVETYAKLHDGWPIELYAGVGASGVAVYPRLLREGE
ncbi:MAG: hypothetical protein IPH13_00880 [Planctomycetes bacterium]|nr:hypothetical protein [Planctomycetota bacterium]